MLTTYTSFAHRRSPAAGTAVQRPWAGIGDAMKRPVVGPAREELSG